MIRRDHPILAIGDIHGDADTLVHILTRLELIVLTEAGGFAWTRPDVTVVFMGDLLDAKSRVGEDDVFAGTRSDLWILEFVEKLRAAAAKAVPRAHVECIVGNHEVMNLVSQFEYVSPHHVHDIASREAYMRGRGRHILFSYHVSLNINGIVFSHAGPRAGAPDADVDGLTMGTAIARGVPMGRLLDACSHRQLEVVPTAARVDAMIADRARSGCSPAAAFVIGHNTRVGPGASVVSPCGRFHYTDVGLSRAFHRAGQRAWDLTVLLCLGANSIAPLTLAARPLHKPSSL